VPLVIREEIWLLLATSLLSYFLDYRQTNQGIFTRTGVFIIQVRAAIRNPKINTRVLYIVIYLSIDGCSFTRII
jgi:hypothetical protein